MITGFNTDIKHNDKVYHIQTEDKGLQNPYIESLVYVGGEILASKKTSYAEQAKTGADEKWIGSLMEQQHRTMIAAIKRGRFDQPADATKLTASRPTAPLNAKTIEALNSMVNVDEDKTLDQVIIDYLASEAESEHLELSLLTNADFVAGTPVEVRVATKKSLSQSPIAAVPIEVKVISTVQSRLPGSSTKAKRRPTERPSSAASCRHSRKGRRRSSSPRNLRWGTTRSSSW